ncbi:MAG: hypothetical protein Aurels2KO_34910 [Aureliella sp.]
MLTGLAAAGATTALPHLRSVAGTTAATSHIATNTYPWLTFARRAEREFALHSEQLLRDIAQAGITGYEPIINTPQEFSGLAARLETHGLLMKSIYVNSVLHDTETEDESSANVLRIATEAKKLGTKIVVTNPSPIRWGGPEDKSDEQLLLQAKSLDALGAELRKIGVTLAYHNHDAELRQGAREFHHMLTATDPENVKFCLDAHWIYRGCGNSEVAVFDALSLYCDRIVELHLRQSSGGTWTEAFSMQGDVDYERLFEFLDKKKIAPHLCLEQAVESASPNTMTALAAHRKGNENLSQARA